MARDDDWDDDEEDRPRRRRRDRYEDDDEYEDDYDDRSIRRNPRGGRSGPVTAIGIIQIVLGSLIVLGSFCALFVGVFLAGAVNVNPGGPGPPQGAGFMGFVGGAVIVFGLIIMIFGGVYIFAGVGILNRRSWARIVSLVLGGFGGLFSVIGLLGAFRVMAQPGQMGAGISNLFISALHLAYVIFMYTILLNARYASEFR